MRTSMKVQALLVTQVFFLFTTVSVVPGQPAPPGAYLVKDLNPAVSLAASSFPAQVVDVGGVGFFVANDGANGAEL